MYGYIYRTTNLVNNKVYIGQRKGTFDSTYYGSGLCLKSAVKKYGKDKFSVAALLPASNKRELDILERKYIKAHRELFGRVNCYNIADGGEGGDTGNPPYVEKVKVKCENCGKVFEALPCHADDARKRQLCSSKCTKEYRNNSIWMHTMTGATLRVHRKDIYRHQLSGCLWGRGKVSENSGFRKGNKLNKLRKTNHMLGRCGDKHHNFGKQIHKTEEARKKCGVQNIGRVPWNKGLKKGNYAPRP